MHVNNINILRILAASLVVILHYCAWQAKLLDGSTILKNVNSVINSSCFIGVPIFILISGALLLRPVQETFSDFYKKRAARIALPTFTWTVFYLLILFFRDHVALKNLVQMTLRGVPFYHLWYMYMLLGLYLFTPFFRILWHNIDSQRKMLLVCAILVLVWLNHAADAVLGITTNNRSPFFNMFVPYTGLFFAGRWIAEIASQTKLRSVVVAIFVLCSFLMGASSFLPQLHGIISYTCIVNNLCAMSLVYLFWSCDDLAWENCKSAILLADASFCVYLLHPALLLLLPQNQLTVIQYIGLGVVFFAASWGIAVILGIFKKIRFVLG